MDHPNRHFPLCEEGLPDFVENHPHMFTLYGEGPLEPLSQATGLYSTTSEESMSLTTPITSLVGNDIQTEETETEAAADFLPETLLQSGPAVADNMLDYQPVMDPSKDSSLLYEPGLLDFVKSHPHIFTLYAEGPQEDFFMTEETETEAAADFLPETLLQSSSAVADNMLDYQPVMDPSKDSSLLYELGLLDFVKSHPHIFTLYVEGPLEELFMVRPLETLHDEGLLEPLYSNRPLEPLLGKESPESFQRQALPVQQEPMHEKGPESLHEEEPLELLHEKKPPEPLHEKESLESLHENGLPEPLHGEPPLKPPQSESAGLEASNEPLLLTAPKPSTVGVDTQTKETDTREAVYFLAGKVLQKGPVTANVLAGTLSQTTKAVRVAAGKNKDGVLDFVKSYPKIFVVSENGVINLTLRVINTSLKSGDDGHAGSEEKQPEPDVTEEAVTYLKQRLIQKGPLSIDTLKGSLTKAIREAAGKTRDEFVKFLELHPHVFTVSKDGIIDLHPKEKTDQIGRAAVKYLKENILDKGPASATVLAGCLAQTTKAIREAAGRNKDGLLIFVKSHPETFTVSKKGTIDVTQKVSNTSTKATKSANDTKTEPKSKKTSTQEAVDYIKEKLMQKGAMSIHTLQGCLSQANATIREAAGKTRDGLLDFLKGNSSVFTVSKEGVINFHPKEQAKDVPTKAMDAPSPGSSNKNIQQVNGTSRREAVEFLKEKLKQKGTVSIDTLQGCLSQTTKTTREAAGKTKEGLLKFLKGNPSAFTVSKHGVIDLHPDERAKDGPVETVDTPPSGIGSSVQNVQHNTQQNAQQMDVERNVVKFLEEKPNQKGPASATILAGSLSGTTKPIREAAGKNDEGLLSFAKRHPDKFTVSKEGIIVLNERYQIEATILKNVVLLLLANHEMAYRELLSTLTEMMPHYKKEFPSEENLLFILDKYDLFERGAVGVCLKAVPSEGYITKLDGEYGFIDKATHKRGAFFHQSAVYIPPQVHVTNELDYQLKVKSCVKYISVSDSSVPSSVLPRRAILVWLTGGPNMMKLQQQVNADGKTKLPTMPSVPANQVKHKNESRMQKPVLRVTTENPEKDKGIFYMNPTLDSMTMVYIFMSMLTQKVTSISRQVLACYPGLPKFVATMLADAAMCRAFTSRYPTILNLSDDGSTLTLLHLPKDTSGWSMKDVQVTLVWPNSAIADSKYGRVFIFRQDCLCFDGTSPIQSMNVPKGKLKSALKVGDKLTCLTVSYQVPTPVLPGAESSKYQAILAWQSSYGNRLDSIPGDINGSPARDPTDRLQSLPLDGAECTVEIPVYVNCPDGSSGITDPLPNKRVSNSVNPVLDSAVKETMKPKEVVQYPEDIPNNATSCHSPNYFSNRMKNSGEQSAILEGATAGLGTNQKQLEMLEQGFVSLSKTVAGTSWIAERGSSKEVTTISKLAESLLSDCTKLNSTLKDLERSESILNWMEQSSTCIQSEDDSASFNTCSSQIDELLPLEDAVGFEGLGEVEGQCTELKTERVEKHLDKLQNGFDNCQNKDSGQEQMVLSSSKSNGALDFGIMEELRGSSHIEIKDHGPGVSDENVNASLNEKFLKEVLFEIACLGRSIEERMKVDITCDECCHAQSRPSVDNSSQTVLVNKASSGAQTLSTGHIVMSGYRVE